MIISAITFISLIILNSVLQREGEGGMWVLKKQK